MHITREMEKVVRMCRKNEEKFEGEEGSTFILVVRH